MKRILASLAALFLIPCLPLAFVAVSQPASKQSTTETNQKAEQSEPLVKDTAESQSEI